MSKQITVTCIERNKSKTYTGKLITDGMNVVIFATWDKKGSSYIKQIKKSNILSYRVN